MRRMDVSDVFREQGWSLIAYNDDQDAGFDLADVVHHVLGCRGANRPGYDKGSWHVAQGKKSELDSLTHCSHCEQMLSGLLDRLAEAVAERQ
jgi:hypothetical protein